MRFNDVNAALKTVYGYDSFRPGQREAVSALLAGRDVMAIMPTGGGKSICYQLPAIVGDGITIVISPLISLMKDQVDQLRQLGVNAAALNSSVDPGEARTIMAQAHSGALRLLYIAPERLDYEGSRDGLWSCPVSRVVVDEAHCVSQWGHDFRQSYLGIADFIAGFETRPTVGAFTATATPRVEEDVITLLRLDDPVRVKTGFDRQNLIFSALRMPKKQRLQWIRRYIAAHVGQCGIIYCSSRRDTEALAGELGALCYHAGMSDEARRAAQDAFISDRGEIICATNAFGMGIDKPDVRFVIHYQMPSSIEAYWQEAGRAGRDGLDSECVLLCDGSDAALWSQMIAREDCPDDEKQNKRRRLSAISDYSRAAGCLRKYLVGYFGEKTGDCGVCSNCVGGETVDITREAQMIMSTVKRCGERVGKTAVAGILMGSREQRTLERGWDSLSTYGLMKDKSRREITDMIEELTAQGYIAVEGGEYPILRLNGSCLPVLRGEAAVTMRVLRSAYDLDQPGAQDKAPKRGSADKLRGDPLYEKLRSLRRALAEQSGIPPFVIFGDKTLIDMVAKRPRTPGEMLDVSGVGEFKLKKYGKAFLDAINGDSPTASSDPAPPAEQPQKPAAARRGKRLAEAPASPAVRGCDGVIHNISQRRLVSDAILFLNAHSAEFLRDFPEYSPDDLRRLCQRLRAVGRGDNGGDDNGDN